MLLLVGIYDRHDVLFARRHQHLEMILGTSTTTNQDAVQFLAGIRSQNVRRVNVLGGRQRARGNGRSFDECTAGKCGFHILMKASNYSFLAYDATPKGNIERSLDKTFFSALLSIADIRVGEPRY